MAQARKQARPKIKYYIFIPDLNESEEDAEEFISAFTEPTMIASEYAENLYRERDGWEWMQPSNLYDIVIIYPTGRQVPVEITFDLEPMFFAVKKHQTTPKEG